jgi:hypothetical protein
MLLAGPANTRPVRSLLPARPHSAGPDHGKPCLPFSCPRRPAAPPWPCALPPRRLSNTTRSMGLAIGMSGVYDGTIIDANWRSFDFFTTQWCSVSCLPAAAATAPAAPKRRPPDPASTQQAPCMQAYSLKTHSLRSLALLPQAITSCYMGFIGSCEAPLCLLPACTPALPPSHPFLLSAPLSCMLMYPGLGRRGAVRAGRPCRLPAPQQD